MSEDHPTKRLDELVDAGTIAMLMTMIGDRHSSRPLSVAAAEQRRLSFLVDRTVDWVQAIDQPGTVVHLSVADVRHNVYVSLNGTAAVRAEKAETDLLWNPGAAAFFDGKDDPDVAALHFNVTDGEYWDAPSGRIGSAIAMLKAAVTGDAAGDRGSIS